MLAFGQGMDAMERQTVRATPNHDITVHQRNAPNPLATLLAAPKEDRRQAQRYGHDRLIKITLIAILMQRQSCARYIAVNQAPVGRDHMVAQRLLK